MITIPPGFSDLCGCSRTVRARDSRPRARLRPGVRAAAAIRRRPAGP